MNVETLTRGYNELRGRISRTLDGVRAELLEYLAEIDVGATRKHHKFVQRLVVEPALEPARLEAWWEELTARATPAVDGAN